MEIDSASRCLFQRTAIQRRTDDSDGQQTGCEGCLCGIRARRCSGCSGDPCRRHRMGGRDRDRGRRANGRTAPRPRRRRRVFSAARRVGRVRTVRAARVHRGRRSGRRRRPLSGPREEHRQRVRFGLGDDLQHARRQGGQVPRGTATAAKSRPHFNSGGRHCDRADITRTMCSGLQREQQTPEARRDRLLTKHV